MMTELMMTAKLCATKTMTKPKPNRALYRRPPAFKRAGGFVFVKETITLLLKLLSLLELFCAGVILGLWEAFR